MAQFHFLHCKKKKNPKPCAVFQTPFFDESLLKVNATCYFYLLPHETRLWARINPAYRQKFHFLYLETGVCLHTGSCHCINLHKPLFHFSLTDLRLDPNRSCIKSCFPLTTFFFLSYRFLFLISDAFTHAKVTESSLNTRDPDSDPTFLNKLSGQAWNVHSCACSCVEPDEEGRVQTSHTRPVTHQLHSFRVRRKLWIFFAEWPEM